MRVLALLLAVSLLAPSGAVAQAMRDVPAGSMYAEAVAHLQRHGMAQGYSDGSFRPDAPINRAELAKILMGSDADMSQGHCFRDVASEWFAPYVCSARSHGMVSGYPDGSFKPENRVTFVEAAAMVARHHEGDMPASGGSWYMPYALKVQEWGAVPPSVQWMDAPITRGEMAYMVWKSDMAHGAPSAADQQSFTGPVFATTAGYFYGNGYRSNSRNDHDDDDDVRERMELSVVASKDAAKPGDQVQFTVTVENHDDNDHTMDLAASLDEELLFAYASDSPQADNEWVTWNDMEVEAGDEMVFTILATVSSNAPAGSSQSIEVFMDDVVKSDSVTVLAGVVASPVGDPILHWNAIAIAANAADHTYTYGDPEEVGPGASSRALAIVHAAMFDAVNSIDRTYQPYITLVPVPAGQTPSIDAAVATAAHQALIALYPNQRSVFDAARQDHLSKLADDAATSLGISVGQTAATHVLAERQGDGSRDNVHYTPSQDPGRHRVDPLNPTQPFLGPNWGNVAPFVLQNSSQFRAPPPPPIDSPEYAQAFNQVLELGGDGVVSATLRTHEQTLIGLYWAYDGVKKIGTPPRLFNQIARAIAVDQGNTVVENARLFALVNIAMADAGIACWESKYHYDYWRPVVGIREADEGTGPTGLGDNNPLTTGDVQWKPLGAPMSNMTAGSFTPPFPAYPSGHATFGAAALGVIKHFYGTDNVPFTLVSDELNGSTTDEFGNARPYHSRSFSRLSDAVQENGMSRVYLGVHWSFDSTAGIDMGYDIADYVYGNALQPLR